MTVARHRIDFTKTQLSLLAATVAKHRVPITLERIAPDGTKVRATANTQPISDSTNDLDRELQEFEAGHGEAGR
jgi:hypothetical protein